MSGDPGDQAAHGEHADQAAFWSCASILLDRPGITRSTMMGLPCLRLNGAFFAACDRRTGDLLVKLAEQRVNQLIEAGQAQPFAPAGRRFRQWASVPAKRSETWAGLLDEALVWCGGETAQDHA